MGHAGGGWEKLNCAANSNGIGLGDVDCVALIGLGRKSDIPAVYALGGPGAALGGCFVEDNFGTQWCQRGTVEIEGAVEVGLG